MVRTVTYPICEFCDEPVDKPGEGFLFNGILKDAFHFRGGGALFVPKANKNFSVSRDSWAAHKTCFANKFKVNEFRPDAPDEDEE